MLDVTLPELTGSRSQYVLAALVRSAINQRHHVLKLIPEPVGAAGLIVGRACPDAASQDLVQQPTIYHQIQAGIRRRDLYRVQDVVPVARSAARLSRARWGSAYFRTTLRSSSMSVSLSKNKNNFLVLAGCQGDVYHQRRTGVLQGPKVPRAWFVSTLRG